MATFNIKNNSTSSTRTIRQGPGVVYASVDNLPAGGSAIGDFCYTYAVANTTLQASAGDKWIQIAPNRWLAWIHKGVPYLIVDVMPGTGADVANLAVTVKLPVTMEFRDAAGNLIATKTGAGEVELK